MVAETEAHDNTFCGTTVRNLISSADSDSKTGWVEFDVNSFVARVFYGFARATLSKSIRD